MIIDNLTNLLDSPVTTVFLVVAFGGLFMRIVWLPYRATTVNLNKNNRYKKEVFLRLTELQLSFENIFYNLIFAPSKLSHSIKVVRQILILFVEVRILVGQQVTHSTLL